MEKRRCFGVSSWIGGESGRSIGSRTCKASLSAVEVEDGLSWGGVTGGAGIAGVDPLALVAEAEAEAEPESEAAASAAAPTSAKRVEGERRRAGRSMLEVAVRSGGSPGSLEGGRKLSGRTVDRRNSESLARLPRLLRRNGMADGGQDHHSYRIGWKSTASTHAHLPAISQAVQGRTQFVWSQSGRGGCSCPRVLSRSKTWSSGGQGARGRAENRGRRERTTRGETRRDDRRDQVDGA